MCERDSKAELEARLRGTLQEAVPTLHTCANESKCTRHIRAVFPLRRSIPVTRISSNCGVFVAEVPARALPAGALGDTGMRRVAALAANRSKTFYDTRKSSKKIDLETPGKLLFTEKGFGNSIPKPLSCFVPLLTPTKWPTKGRQS